jgi:hypothetical protein
MASASSANAVATRKLRRGVGGKFVVSAAVVMDEGMPAGDQPDTA